MTKYIITAIAFLSLIGIISLQNNRLKKVTEDRDRWNRNANTLNFAIDQYRTKDSLNAVSSGIMELSLSEYKKYRKDDMELIESLKVDKNRLQQVMTANTKTVYPVQTIVRDSIIYVDHNITETVRCVTVHERWLDIDGCTDRNGEFRGTIATRDSLLIVRHVIPKKFLGIIKYGIKEERLEAVPRNPYTVIEGIGSVTIKK